MSVRIRDLGPLELDRGGAIVPVAGRRLTALLAALAVRANQRVSADALVDALWGDDDRTDGATLDSHLWRLRRLIEPDHRRGEPFRVIVNDAGGFRLLVGPGDIDSALFERLADEVGEALEQQRPELARATADEALALWRGSPWEPHTDDSWAAAAAARLLERRTQVAEQRIDALLASGEAGAALADLEVLLTDHPLREHLWGQRMLAAYATGKTADALATYAQARQVLVDEVGLDPGAELQRLHARILAEDPTLVAASEPFAPVRLEERAVTAFPVELHLPPQRGRLRGRDADAAAVADLLGPGRLVTVVGAAGCGKTSLAVRVAGGMAERFSDGIHFVDLIAAGDRDQVIDAITSALRLAAPAGVDGAEALGGLAGRRLLIVLDNCEHVIDEAAELVDAIVQPDAALCVLATSREPLGVDAETVWELLPLALPEPGLDGEFEIDPERLDDEPAVALFVDRLRAGRPQRELGPQELALAAQVCRAVDGLPLAIELAASQAQSFSLAEIADRVHADPAGLARIGRGGQRHHTSLRSTIEASSAALPPDERAMYQAVSVVPGPFSTELAAALAGTTMDRARDLLSALVHRSMLSPLGPRREGRPSRFAQLTTLRAHAMSTLSASGLEALAARRDAHIREIVRDIPDVGDRRETAVYDRIEDDLAAVRATLQSTLLEHPDPIGSFVAGRLAFFWYYRGMAVEWERWMRLGETVATADPLDRLLCRVGRFGALMLMRRPPTDLEDLAGIDRPRDLDERFARLSAAEVVLVAQLLLAVACAAHVVDQHAPAAVLARLGEKLAESTTSAHLDLLAECARVCLLLATDTPQNALLAAEAAYRRAQQMDSRFAATVVTSVGTGGALGLGDLDAAIVWSDRHLAANDALGLDGNSYALEFRGANLALSGRHLEALEFFAASQSIARRTGWGWPTFTLTARLQSQARAALPADAAEEAERRGAALVAPSVLEFVRGGAVAPVR